MLPTRTCTRRHYCKRQQLARKRAQFEESMRLTMAQLTHMYEGLFLYEVWDPTPEDDNEPSLEFTTDDNAAALAFIGQGAHRCELRNNGQCRVCDLYDMRRANLALGRVQPFYIIAVGISRYCYSPAEGGCWADWETILDVRRAFTFKEGLKQLRTLKDEHPQPRFNRFSAANRGEDDIEFVLCYGENDPRWPKETTERATYE